MKPSITTILKALSIVVLISATNMVWAGLAGNVVRVNGDASAKDAKGKVRPLNADSEVNEGDTITTAKDATIQVQMKDGALIAMTGDGALKVVAYKYEEAGGAPDKIDLVLERGRFRTITGAADKKNYSLSTPEAKIAINGTTFDLLVNADGTTSILRNGEVVATVLSSLLQQVLNVPGMAFVVGADGKTRLTTDDEIDTSDLDSVLAAIDPAQQAAFQNLVETLDTNDDTSIGGDTDASP